jgi:Protein of unknown function (DUF1236)
MRPKLYLMTTALSVVLGASGFAVAQDRLNDSKQAKPHSSMQRQTTGQAPSGSSSSTSSDRIGASGTSQTGSDMSPPSSAQNKAPTNQPSSAHSNTTQQQPTAQRERNERNEGTAQRERNERNEGMAQRERNERNEGASSAQREHNMQNQGASSAERERNMRNERSSAQRERNEGPSSAQRERNERSEGTGPTSSSTRQGMNERGEAKERLSASLQGSQRTRLHEAIGRLDARPISNVNFSVAVGTTIPSSVNLVPVPESIVAVLPEYRGYDYFVVRDEVVIVQPRTHRIVDVIERGGASRAEATTSHRLHLSSHQREIIRKHYTSRRTVTTGAAPRAEHVVVGEDVPQTVTIERFPDEVYREVPEIRDYRYIEGDNGLYLVEPGSRRVIEEIE